MAFRPQGPSFCRCLFPKSREISRSTASVYALSSAPTWRVASISDTALSRYALSTVLKNDNGNHYGNKKGETETTIETEAETSSLGILGGDGIYYGEKGGDIYITVHISNPDAYEILSFTLNGEKYSSYMFERGSDMEHLILKKNVGDAEGIVEYTIDAIKYVDGTEIKDVRMDGDRTVKVGIYTDKQPEAKVSKAEADFNAVSLEVSLTDELRLIAQSAGKARAALYLGETKVAEKELTIGTTNAIIFDGLELNTEYRYAIEADYDNLSGEGRTTYTLAQGTIRTLEALKFDGVASTQGEIVFDLVWNEAYEEKELIALELYLGGEKVRELALTDRSVTGLFSNNKYILRATYFNGSEEKFITYPIKTQAKAAPTVAITNPVKTQTSVGFDLEITDVDMVGALTKIELVHANGTVEAQSLTQRSFTNLLSNNTYTVRVTYTYDLNDGEGIHTIVKTLDVKTDAKAVPTVAITNPVKTQTSVGFDLEITDVDMVGALTKIELVHANGTVEAQDLTQRSFTNLLSNNTYTVRVTYTYDLNDGQGFRRTTQTLAIHTQHKTAPTISVQDEEITYQSIVAEYVVTDPDSILASRKVELYKGDVLVSENGEKKIHFTGLDYYTDYTVKITYTYDLNDGQGVQTGVVQKFYKTLPYVDVTACEVTTTGTIVTGDTIYVQVTVDNPMNLSISGIKINGQVYGFLGSPITGGPIIIVKVTCGDQFVGGANELRVEGVISTLDGTEYDLVPPTKPSATAFINGSMEVLKVEYTNSSFEPVAWAFPSDTIYTVLTLDNPTGYTITSVTVQGGGTVVPTKIDDNHYYFIGKPISLVYANEYVTKTISSLDSATWSSYPHIVASDTVHYISTPDDLLNMDDNYYYELTGDIDLAGRQWQGNSFYGVFDGKGYAIKNLTRIDESGTGDSYDKSSLGLFSTTYGGVIRNLKMEGVMIIVGHGSGGFLIGCIENGSSILLEYCYIDKTSIINLGDYAGGFIGWYESIGDSKIIINGCENYGTISASYAGGIVGFEMISVEDMEIINCINGGVIYGLNEATGIARGGTIINCVNIGSVSGGGVGIALYGEMTNCLNIGSVQNGDRVGGLTDNDDDGIIINSYTLTPNDANEPLCTVEQLNTKSFYTETLGWSEDVWDLSELDVENGKYPKLKSAN